MAFTIGSQRRRQCCTSNVKVTIIIPSGIVSPRVCYERVLREPAQSKRPCAAISTRFVWFEWNLASLQSTWKQDGNETKTERNKTRRNEKKRNDAFRLINHRSWPAALCSPRNGIKWLDIGMQQLVLVSSALKILRNIGIKWLGLGIRWPPVTISKFCKDSRNRNLCCSNAFDIHQSITGHSNHRKNANRAFENEKNSDLQRLETLICYVADGLCLN